MSTTVQQDTDRLSQLHDRAVMFDVLKGGCGKSALSLNLADRLAARGNDVLYLDLDPNGHITFALGYQDVFLDSAHDYGYVTLDQQIYKKYSADPDDMIYTTEFGFDFVPSYDDMEAFEAALNDVDQSPLVLARDFLLPLYESGEYDYFVMDGGGERSNIADCGFAAGLAGIVPLIPGNEALSAWARTYNRVISELEEKVHFNLMAVVPNLLSSRVDHNNADRQLLEDMNNSDRIRSHIPDFARLSDDDWERIDAGDYGTLPGIREREAIQGGIKEGMPAAHYDPECDQIDHFDELARIVENGGVSNG